MARRLRYLLVALIALASSLAVAGPASATTVNSGQCSVTANTPVAVYVSPSLRIHGTGSADCNYDWTYQFFLMTTLQQYSTYFHSWSNVAQARSITYGGGGGTRHMTATASYTCANGQFRTAAQVEVDSSGGAVVLFRTTPAYSATFTESYC